MKRKLLIIILFFTSSVLLGQIIKTYQYQADDGSTFLHLKNDTVQLLGNGGHIFLANIDITDLDTLNTYYLNSTGLDIAMTLNEDSIQYLYGSATGFSSGIWNLFYSKLNENFEPVITRSYKSSLNYPLLRFDFEKSINAFYFGFITKNNSSFGPPWDIGILKGNLLGDTIIHRVYDSGESDEVKNIEIKNENIYSLGITSKVDTLDFLLMKLDTNLNPLFAKAIGGASIEGGGGLINDNDIYLYGDASQYSFGVGEDGLLLIRVDTNGNLIKGSYFYSNTRIASPNLKIIDNRIYLMAKYDPFGGGIFNAKCLLLELDTNFTILDTLSLNFSSWSEYISDLIKIPPNNFLFAAWSEYNSNGLKNVKLFTTDSTFSNSCLPTFPVTISSIDVTSQLHSTPISMSTYHHQITVTSDTFETNRGFSSVTTDCVVGEKEVEMQELMFDVYPNPFSGSITFSTETEGEYELKIFDVSGKLIEQKYFSGNSFSYGNGLLTKGIYFYEILQERKVVGRGKLVKQ